MSNTPSDWVSFADYLGLHRGEMESAYAKAQADAAQQDETARYALQQAQNDSLAAMQGGKGAQGVGQQASYSDYLKARDAAKMARMRMTPQGQGSALESSMFEGMGYKADPGGPDYNAQQAGAESLDWQRQQSLKNSREQYAAIEAKRQAELAARSAQYEQVRKQMLDKANQDMATVRDPTKWANASDYERFGRARDVQWRLDPSSRPSQTPVGWSPLPGGGYTSRRKWK